MVSKSDFGRHFAGFIKRLHNSLQAKLLNTIPGITTIRPDDAFFGVTNDNLTFGDIVKPCHQYRYN